MQHSDLSLDLSIVIPVFNEEGNLRPLCAEIRSALESESRSYEVILVDDGSTDGSPFELRSCAAEDDRLRVLELPRNVGQSIALLVGLRAASGAIVVTLDADLQNDPADIPDLVRGLEGFDLVSGIRARRQDSWVRKVSSRIGNTVRRWVLGDSIVDIGCSLKAYRAPWLKELPAFDGLHRFLPSLLESQGAKVRQMPVHHRPRVHGQSKYGIHNRLWRGLFDLVGVRWLIRRWPARLPDACGSSLSGEVRKPESSRQVSDSVGDSPAKAEIPVASYAKA